MEREWYFVKFTILLYFTAFMINARNNIVHGELMTCDLQDLQDFSYYLVDTPAKSKQITVAMTWNSVVNHWLFDKYHSKYTDDKAFQHCKDLEHPKIRAESHTWYPVKDRKVMSYSAFYERRMQADGISVRILAAGYQAAYNDIGALFCQIWFSDRMKPISVSAEYKVIYQSTMHPDMWVAHFVICKIPTQYLGTTVPYAVSLTGTPCETAEHHLFILNRDARVVTDTFGVCLSPIYMRFKNWTMVIEMFEMHKLLGASEIVAYDNSVHQSTDAVLHSYNTDSNENIHVYQWKIPGGNSKTVSLNIQRAALNDCLYRLAHRHKFVAVQDLDEVMVPRKGTTWQELFFKHNLYQPHYGLYMFQHFYFRRNDTDKVPYFVTQNSFWRTDTVYPAGKIRCKSMYNGQLAVKIDVHYHYELVTGAEPYMVDPSEGVLHHYRNQPMETFRKYPERFTFVEDKHMSFYEERLEDGYRHRLAKLDTSSSFANN